MQKFLDFIREKSFTKKQFPARVEHVAFFFQDRLEVRHNSEVNSLQVPFMGFIQAKQETALFWAHWLAQYHPEIKFKKVVGNIAFTSEYEQATKLHADPSQGWFLLNAGIRQDFYTQGCSWAFSGSIQVKTSSSPSSSSSHSVNSLNAARTSFVDAYLPKNNPQVSTSLQSYATRHR